jgi:ketosteroid isomerase-like protein
MPTAGATSTPIWKALTFDVEWYPFTGQAEGGGAYRGHEGVRQWWSNLETNLDSFEASVDECRDLGDTVIAFGQLRIRFKSGVGLEQAIAWVARFRDGVFIWVAPFAPAPKPSKPPGCGNRR